MNARWVAASEPQPPLDARRFVGKTAIITGASSGIGLATARRLIAEGARVAGFARGRDGLERARGELGPDFHPVAVDVRDPASIESGVAEAVAWLGGAPDVLIQSAAVFLWAPALETSLDLWDETMETNLRGSFLVACAVVRAALGNPERGLSIVNISSTGAYRGLASEPSSAYSASKIALGMLTEQLALEWAPLGIRVNIVVPGLIDTPMLKIMEVDPEAGQAFLDEHVPQRRIGTADECAALICFVASDESPYMTGTSIRIDGGRLLA
jgi:NAD(P)-dependent dehydrogenase (short-subunit alcohol dehydrogenase family)